MAQFDVHRNGDTYLLDCQSDLLADFGSRVVIPLVAVGAISREFSRLTPRVRVRGEEFLLATHLMTAIDRRHLGPTIDSLTQDRYTIINAIDVLTGSG